MKLTFLNHASYFIEDERFIIITDPWLEGVAFNNGWSLLDQTTSNEAIIEYIKSKNKKTYIWYSHEHSDHFAIPFIKLAKANEINLHVLFQQTEDRRVFDFLSKMRINVTLLKSGEKFPLSEKSSIKIWSWKSGDSFSLLDFNGFKVLNLNDCIIRNEKDALKINHLIDGRSNANEIDILFTQFGYASWCGNEEDFFLRKIQSEEKCDRIFSQINVLKPKATVLFASFVYFSHEDNFYLNDQQNTPQKIRENISLAELQNDIFFMKPNDFITLDHCFNRQLHEQTSQAEAHWNNIYKIVRPKNPQAIIVTKNAISDAFELYRKRVLKNFFLVFYVAELIGFIKPLRIKIDDVGLVANLSYVKGISFSENCEFDLAMKGEVVLFTIERDYGFDSTHVNGRFRVGNGFAIVNAMYFFGPQNLLKNGYGIKKPVATLKELYRLSRRG